MCVAVRNNNLFINDELYAKLDDYDDFEELEDLIKYHVESYTIEKERRMER